jgi:hypothetical protein
MDMEPRRSEKKRRRERTVIKSRRAHRTEGEEVDTRQALKIGLHHVVVGGSVFGVVQRLTENQVIRNHGNESERVESGDDGAIEVLHELVGDQGAFSTITSLFRSFLEQHSGADLTRNLKAKKQKMRTGQMNERKKRKGIPYSGRRC